MSTAAADERPWPPRRSAWSMTALLTLAYIFSFVDRRILGLLIEPIKADLGLSDASMGLLIGVAFGLFYATIGVPLGWAADRFRRTWLVAGGVILWSFATAASGLARSFGHLFVARMAVGVGEAVLSPSAMSMISDSFPPERRGKPVAIYSSAVSLGAGIAGLVGAGVLTWAQSSAGVTLPIVGAVKPWQLAFFIVGLPGLFIGLGFLLLGEPVRRTERAAVDAAGFGATFRYVGRNIGAFGGMVSLVCLMTTIAYSHEFMPATFARSFGWSVRDYALINGITTIALMPATVTFMGILSDRLRARGIRDAAFRILVVGYLVMIPFSVAGPLMPTGWAAFGVLIIGNMAIATITAAGIIALLDIAPAAMRGQIVALFYMTISITGLGLGPTTVGILSTTVFGESELRLAVAVVPLIYGVLPLLLLPLIRRAYLRQLESVS